MELDKDRDFVYDSESKLTFGGQVNFWLNKIMGYQVKVNIYSFTQDTKGCSIPIKIPVNGDGKALNNAEGFFDQIDKDLNVILGW